MQAGENLGKLPLPVGRSLAVQEMGSVSLQLASGCLLQRLTQRLPLQQTQTRSQVQVQVQVQQRVLLGQAALVHLVQVGWVFGCSH